MISPTLFAARSATVDLALFDSHAHLDADAFDSDRERVIETARAAGVADMLVPATTAASWPDIDTLCAQATGLYAAYGLHPCYLDRHGGGDLDALAAWLHTHAAAAIGECGLDFSLPRLDRERQLQLLRGHFELARQFDLPLVLHARRAFEQVILELQRFRKPLRGVVHSFSGSLEQAARLRTLGFMVGIGGPVTYPRAHRLRRVVATVPIDSLLLETDSPDQPGVEHRGERNEPAFLREVLGCVAELRKVSTRALADATTTNARRLFTRT
ncbi:MAG TPA: TatD family hydrolase [Rhodanobacteraceae bacterium]|nr:TatD family hydrolase [Rhodanobacteraceae bacterium]